LTKVIKRTPRRSSVCLIRPGKPNETNEVDESFESERRTGSIAENAESDETIDRGAETTKHKISVTGKRTTAADSINRHAAFQDLTFDYAREEVRQLGRCIFAALRDCCTTGGRSNAAAKDGAHDQKHVKTILMNDRLLANNSGENGARQRSKVFRSCEILLHMEEENVFNDNFPENDSWQTATLPLYAKCDQLEIGNEE
jgi:hypothetical protein